MANNPLSLRKWATPLTIGSFIIVGVTGVLWYFGVVTGTARWLHEIIGLVIVAAVVLHVVLNWRPFKNYFRKPFALGIIAICSVATVYGYLAAEEQSRGGRPDFAVIQKLGQADLATIAPIFGETGDELAAAFQSAGFTDADGQSSINELTADDPEKRMGAFAVLASQ